MQICCNIGHESHDSGELFFQVQICLDLFGNDFRLFFQAYFFFNLD